ncbi:MAG TPA: NUDIX domain-containing protein [Ktedonobacteraceae bacterium]|nr:NUDIX domain-containing protein [Ktedonobacteraceae bacterium]
MKQNSSWQPGQPLRETPVVTCFLTRTDGAQSLLLLVRRSQRVGSYNARWAGVSGFIEVGVPPDEQAFTEIREETGLQREQVHMLRRGVVVEYVDASLGRHWFIHPYLFKVRAPDAIQLDWEATEMRWIAPSELPNFETVPKLMDAYASAVRGEIIASV